MTKKQALVLLICFILIWGGFGLDLIIWKIKRSKAMNIKIADIELSNDERLYGTLIKDLEKMGYLVIKNNFSSNHYIIARKSEQE